MSGPDEVLAALIDESGMSAAGLARRISDLDPSHRLNYDCTAVYQWISTKKGSSLGPAKLVVAAEFARFPVVLPWAGSEASPATAMDMATTIQRRVRRVMTIPHSRTSQDFGCPRVRMEFGPVASVDGCLSRTFDRGSNQ